MKTHAIIPIFIAHRGCPNDCVFCNQKKITAREGDVTPEDAIKTIDQWLTTLEDVKTVELAFYGGSFTGIPIEEQTAFLKVAKDYKDRGLIDKIHLSTRPDYINEEILDNLERYGVNVIELGVQSLDENVLAQSGRGHSEDVVYKASSMIKKRGFELGIQLMIGLPGDTKEKAVRSAEKTVDIGPAIARLYPTVILNDTKLADMWRDGTYIPPNRDEMINITSAMYRILDGAGINIIRVGLKSTDLINDKKAPPGTEGAVLGGSFHPSFRQLVESRIAKDSLEEQLAGLESAKTVKKIAEGNSPQAGEAKRKKLTFICNPRDISNMIGNRGSNRKYFHSNYTDYDIIWTSDEKIPRGEYRVKRRI